MSKLSKLVKKIFPKGRVTEEGVNTIISRIGDPRLSNLDALTIALRAKKFLPKDGHVCFHTDDEGEYYISCVLLD